MSEAKHTPEKLAILNGFPTEITIQGHENRHNGVATDKRQHRQEFARHVANVCTDRSFFDSDGDAIDERTANAAHIVACWNAHDALVAACKAHAAKCVLCNGRGHYEPYGEPDTDCRECADLRAAIALTQTQETK